MSNIYLLDKEGVWFSRSDKESMKTLNGKFGVGFLQDSHYNVYGYINKGGMTGYACSHFRALSEQEIKDKI